MLGEVWWFRGLSRERVCSLATLGPVGFWPKMPGTWGSLLGLFYYTVVFHGLNGWAYGALLCGTLWASVGICGAAARHFGKKDPQCVILDEFAAIPVCFIGLGEFLDRAPAWPTLLLGFLLFRFFDIFKPLGIARLQNYPGGLGIVLDDGAAGLATAVCLHGLAYFWGKAWLSLTL